MSQLYKLCIHQCLNIVSLPKKNQPTQIIQPRETVISKIKMEKTHALTDTADIM